MSYDMDGANWFEVPNPRTRLLPPTSPPCQRPWRETPPDLDAITAWTANQQRAQDAYDALMADLDPNPTTAEDAAEQARLSHLLANRRYRARKAER